MFVVLSGICALVFSLFFMQEGTLHRELLQYIVFGSTATAFFSSFFIAARFQGPLNKIRQKSAPRIEGYFSSDRLLLAIQLFLGVFMLLSGIGCVSSLFTSVAFWYWFLLWGLSLDLFWLYQRRVYKYANVEFLLLKIKKRCVHAAHQGPSVQVYDEVEAVFEILIKAVFASDLFLVRKALSTLQQIIERVVKVLSQRELQQIDPDVIQPSLFDEVQSLSAFLCRRLSWVLEIAASENLIPAVESVMTLYAKMGLFLAEIHKSLIKFPLAFLDQAARNAAEKGPEEVLDQALCTLSELVKQGVVRALQKRVSAKDIALPILLRLENIVKKIFQEKRETNVALLMQPFAEIGQLLSDPIYQAVIDRDEFMMELRRILQEFGALDIVLQRRGEQQGSTTNTPSNESSA